MNASQPQSENNSATTSSTDALREKIQNIGGWRVRSTRKEKYSEPVISERQMDDIMELIAKDREAREAEACAKSKSFCGCPMCLHHTEAYMLREEKNDG